MKEMKGELQESDEPPEEKIKQVEEILNKSKTLINRIEWIGKIGYPIILIFIVAMIWIFYIHR